MGNFGENLRAIRIQRGLSQDALAQLLGTSKQVISRYENGQRSPKVSAAAKYAEILGVSLAALNGEEEAPLPHPDLLKVHRRRIPLMNGTRDELLPEAQPVDGAGFACDFAIIVQDTSMQPRFLAGDTVFLRSQGDVPDGQIAAVQLDGQILLRRIYHLPDGMQLIAENPAFPPMILKNDSAAILGLAIRFSRSLA